MGNAKRTEIGIASDAITNTLSTTHHSSVCDPGDETNLANSYPLERIRSGGASGDGTRRLKSQIKVTASCVTTEAKFGGFPWWIDVFWPGIEQEQAPQRAGIATYLLTG
jgi:hypothetical protein